MASQLLNIKPRKKKKGRDPLQTIKSFSIAMKPPKLVQSVVGQKKKRDFKYCGALFYGYGTLGLPWANFPCQFILLSMMSSVEQFERNRIQKR